MIKYGLLTETGRPLHREHCSLPAPQLDEVLVRVTAAGLCGSDLSLSKGTTGSRNWLPTVLSHEIAGRVAALGPKCSSRFTVGQRVVVYPWVSNANARRYRGRFIGGGIDGGFASHCLVPEEQFLVAIPDSMSDEEVCLLACSGLTAYSALRKGGIPDHLVIIGAGGVGLQAIRLARAIKSITVIDIDQKKLDAARTVGPQGLSTLLLSEPRTLSVLDFVGHQATIDFCLQQILYKAPLSIVSPNIIIVGLMGGKIQVDAQMLLVRQAQIRSSLVGSMEEFKGVLQAVSESKAKIPIEVRDSSDINKSLEEMANRKIVGRLVFKSKL